MRQSVKWLAGALFAWFFVYMGPDGQRANVGATPVVVGPFQTADQCTRVRNEMIGEFYVERQGTADVRFGDRYISRCWQG